MKRMLLTTSVLLCSCTTAWAQKAGQPEVLSFELSPAAPPSPALTYQFLFDDPFERLPGNAALLYGDSILLMGRDSGDKAEKAITAYDEKQMSRFDSLADSLENRSLIQELTLAGRREECNWDPPFHEMGPETLLPHLSPLRDMARMLKVRALREIEQGKTEEAIKTVRIGYEMADKVGREPTLISGLVSIGITSMMDDCLVQLMNRADARNLYWALSEFPSRSLTLRHSMDSEKLWETVIVSNLAKADAREEMSANEWRAAFEYVGNAMQSGSSSTNKPKLPDPIAQTSPELMQQAQQYYAQGHQMTAEQAAKVEPMVVIGVFYYQQFRIARDDLYKLRGLSYPELLARTRVFADRLTKQMHEQPANLFLQVLPLMHKGIWAYARVDRQLAGLTAVEAIRSYAAANGGTLPARLEDISDTPVPLNPATGQSFEYKVDNGTATLSDTKSEGSLTYTIQIRK